MLADHSNLSHSLMGVRTPTPGKESGGPEDGTAAKRLRLSSAFKERSQRGVVQATLNDHVRPDTDAMVRPQLLPRRCCAAEEAADASRHQAGEVGWLVDSVVVGRLQPIEDGGLPDGSGRCAFELLGPQLLPDQRYMVDRLEDKVRFVRSCMPLDGTAAFKRIAFMLLAAGCHVGHLTVQDLCSVLARLAEAWLTCNLLHAGGIPGRPHHSVHRGAGGAGPRPGAACVRHHAGNSSLGGFHRNC